MGGREDTSNSNLKEEIFHNFKNFMTGITKIDELVNAGSKLLSGFQQALEFMRKPPIDTKSKLVNKIIVANETKRVKSYVNSGCRNPNNDVQSVTNLHSCKNGLNDIISKAKVILGELEGLLGDVTSSIESLHGNLALAAPDCGVKLYAQASYNDLEENAALSHSQSTDVTITTKKSIDVASLAALMAVIYSMVKQDYLMQERIVSALDLKLLSEELESYCQMWPLRPFINDEIMHQAWKHVH
ncbi:uncharacterized protein LOC130748228 [Lotus japonicus]|uniref:uncharacterized protein LOC130748228 n=1 Tax=Lotus japonicus TaxID=34305 RepID=UPI00258D75B8|nr:uncharacterized protein LOC130748228 [Lotus japonicus]